MRGSERQKALLIVGVVGIGERERERVAEDCGGFAEGDAMFAFVRRRFGGIAFEFRGLG